MPFWRFTQYVTDQPRCPIIEWYGTLEADAQAAFDILCKVLSETEDWDEVKPNRRKYKELFKEHKGLSELLFNLGRRQFRPIGLLLRDRHEFLFLCGCIKTGRGTTDPPNAFSDALQLKIQYEAGRGYTRDHTF